MTKRGTPPATITEHEAQQVALANDSGRTSVMFVHGLWLLPSSWDLWAALFQESAFTALLSNPANRNRAIPLTYDQFRYGFANAVTEEEAQDLYKTFAVPASSAALFQAATANLTHGPRPRSTAPIPSAARR